MHKTPNVNINERAVALNTNCKVTSKFSSLNMIPGLLEYAKNKRSRTGLNIKRKLVIHVSIQTEGQATRKMFIQATVIIPVFLLTL